MGDRIAIIQGHPDPGGNHYCRALADAYRKGAEAAGREVRIIEVAQVDFEILRSRETWQTGTPPDAIRQAQETIQWADHLVIVYPLWLGTMPALLKGFLEQVLRPGFAIDTSTSGLWKKRLTGRSARVIVTMGMPAFAYRWFFGAHSLKSLERNILHFCGIKPVKESLIGMVENPREERRLKWLKKLESLGRDGK